ncbi:MAG: molybdopterin-dependent oxidoreductase [Pseudomonadota bacterium]
MSRRGLTSSHWGIARAQSTGGTLSAVSAHPMDPAPAALLENMVGTANSPARVTHPALRRGWLEGGGTRGRDSYVTVPWDRALDLIASSLRQTIATHGNSAIFAGSYGWASAGRFHHAQSQLKRFLNTLGGFTGSEGNYSYNAALVAMPHILGGSFRDQLAQATRWEVIADHSTLVVAFGGLALRNMQISDGGASVHRIPAALRHCRARGVRFVNISPHRGDMAAELDARWLSPRPGTDTALMLALTHTLLVEGLHDPAFLARYTVGWERVEAYLTGATDGTAKDASWAAEITGLDADDIRALARQMAANRTMITCAAALQRADWGEQPLWACVTLAAALGQIGLPGGGYGIGYAVNGHVGASDRALRAAALPTGPNPVAQRIPVAMIAEMLLRPGAPYRYDGQTHTLPQARLVWWAGGNPFHHHQDLRRLSAAFQTPDLVVVNETHWTATARHADIVLPAAAATERADFGAGKTDRVLTPMHPVADPPGQARSEYAMYTALAERLGVAEAFTEGRDEEAWLRHLWAQTQDSATSAGHTLPDWDRFWAGEPIELLDPNPRQVFLADFRADPAAHPRPTPSGKIELYSDTVAAFALPECPGHATWVPPRDAALPGTLALLSGQPGTRLHSQGDDGALSQASKIAGREPVLIHPGDAAARGIAEGDVVELRSARGACLAGAQVTEDIAPGCVFLATGAWYTPDAEGRCLHGNPNALTHDLRTSEWSQSPAAHSCRVTLSRWMGDQSAPEVHMAQAGEDDPGVV